MTKISLDFTLLESSDPKIKYGFTKELVCIGKENPGLLYPYFDAITAMMQNPGNIIKWTGIDLLGYLSMADTENKIDPLLPSLIGLLHCGQLITCNHSIFALGLIAQSKPQYSKKILNELLLVDKDKFDTDECKNIATGKVLDAFRMFIPEIFDDKQIIEFIQQATENGRNSTKKKAVQLTKKLPAAATGTW